MRRIASWSVLGLLLVLVLALVLLEVGARLYVDDRVAGRVRDQLGARDVSIGIGRTPIAMDLARGRLGAVDVRVRGADLCQLRDVDIEARLHAVRLRGGRRVTSTDAAVTVPTQALEEMVSSMIGLSGTVAITTDPGDDALAVEAGPNGIVRARVVPRLDGDTISTTIASVSLAGLSLPTGMTGTVSQLVGAATARSLGELPMGLHARDLAVTHDGLRLRMHGGPSPLVEDARVSCPS